MRRTIIATTLVVLFFGSGAPALVSAETTTTTEAPAVASSTSTSTTSTTTSTTTTVPTAVTTVPEGCALPAIAQAVFVGTIASLDPVAAVFTVTQVRAGTLDGYINADSLEVRYGRDVKYLKKGKTYIVGVALDSVTSKLSSTIRDSNELFGGAEVAGSNVRCPKFEAAARTLHSDGTSIDSGLFVTIFDQPLRLLAALVLPTLLVFLALLALVWFRRGMRR
ncbi:MAG: hypothetical protein NWP73_00985 [Ilumatobacteraceae bacterium]|jgi:hypothetical protein|nr:hypothetical protein [Ilumatobacteraceae bacterium]